MNVFAGKAAIKHAEYALRITENKRWDKDWWLQYLLLLRIVVRAVAKKKKKTTFFGLMRDRGMLLAWVGSIVVEKLHLEKRRIFLKVCEACWCSQPLSLLLHTLMFIRNEYTSALHKNNLVQGEVGWPWSLWFTITLWIKFQYEVCLWALWWFQITVSNALAT